MKTLYIVRHAKSSWMDPSLSDFDRPLNQRGLRDAGLMPGYLVKKGQPMPKLLVSSSAKRAFMTAKYFMESYELSKDQLILEDKLYHPTEESIYEVIFGLPDEHEVIMIFGHNPGFTDFVNLFSDRYIDNVPTCGIVKLIGNIDHWNQLGPGNTGVDKFYFPKQFIK